MLNLEDLRKNTRLRVMVLDETPSTNAEAKRLALAGEPEGTAVFARRQTRGRGRLGRGFESPSGGIYMSLILRPQESPGQCTRITMAACTGVRRTLKRVLGLEAGIKWVNDLYLGGKKICGILAEGGISGNRLDYAIVGVGLNYESPAFEGELKEKAASLFPGGAPVDINAMAAALLEEVLAASGDFAGEEIYREYREHSLLPGRRVRIMPEGRDALALDITREGRLLVRFDDGRVSALDSGEVSVTGGS